MFRPSKLWLVSRTPRSVGISETLRTLLCTLLITPTVSAAFVMAASSLKTRWRFSGMFRPSKLWLVSRTPRSVGIVETLRTLLSTEFITPTVSADFVMADSCSAKVRWPSSGMFRPSNSWLFSRTPRSDGMVETLRTLLSTEFITPTVSADFSIGSVLSAVR